MAGVYDGDLTYQELARHGDFGLGTFEALDGEMIALEGVFYQIKGRRPGLSRGRRHENPLRRGDLLQGRSGRIMIRDAPELSGNSLALMSIRLLPSPKPPLCRQD